MANPATSFHFQNPDIHRKPVQYRDQYLPADPNTYSHSRTRTTSSNIFPMGHQAQVLYPNHPQNAFASRRTPSQGTFSTIASSGNGPLPARQNSTELRRSTSSRSGGHPQGYVALMRKQKATVWCDRSQLEDPRMVAAKRAAKVRAALEISGANAGTPTSGKTASGTATLVGSNRVAAKIRHHGKAGLVGYNPGDLVGGVGGVPMRLSATEVEGEDSEEDEVIPRSHHRRTGSGRSSLGSNRRGLTYARQSGASSTGRWSAGTTPPGELERKSSIASVPEDLDHETPLAEPSAKPAEYFTNSTGGPSPGDLHRSGTGGSGSSSERADAVGELGGNNAARLASNSLLKTTLQREKSTKNPEELRRRGSVDERTMTMKLGAGRLYIANPDADSD